MARRSAKKSKRIVSVDFEGVELTGGSNVPEGEYLVEVVEVEQEEAQSGNDQLKWKFKVIEGGDGKQKGKTLYSNTVLVNQSLWVLRQLLESLGMETPDSAYDIDLDETIGETLGVVVSLREYEGKDYSNIKEYFSASDFNSDDDDDDDDDDDFDIDEATRPQIIEHIETNHLDISPTQKKYKGKKGLEKLRSDLSDIINDGGEEEEEGITSEEINEMSAKELKELVEENELEVDLIKLKTLKKKREGVISALKEEDLLSE